MESHLQNCLEYFGAVLKLVKSSNQHEEVLHLLVDRIARLYKVQTCAVILIDPKSEYLHVENSIGLSHTFCKAYRRHLSVGKIGELLWTGAPIFLSGGTYEKTLAEEVQLEHPFASCVCVQIAADHQTLGYLHIDSKEPSAFARRDLPLLQAYADIAAIAIHKSRLHDENLRLDTIDRDTGLEKYTSFVVKLEAALERAKHFDERFALLIMDVDNYKTILGTYGYDTALAFLRELGQMLLASHRSIDASARYGFDEFILLLARTEMDAAVDFAREFCSKVEATTFASNRIRTTISIGVSAFPQNGRTVDDLVQTAKKALFEAQRAGRNNVFFYPEEWYVSEGVLHR